jgi:glycosyltransferase involved in cell wall biosynthesis
MTHVPAVSVCMIVLNGSSYIREAVDSILNQTFSDFELVIVDNGSVDGTLDIISSYDDKRIRLIKNSGDPGIAQSRNASVKNARGRYVAIMDSDDVSLPDRLKTQFEYMESHPEVGLLGSWARIIDQAGKTADIRKFRKEHDVIRASILFFFWFVHSSVFFRKELFPEDGYRLPYSEDYDMVCRFAEKAEIAILDKVLVKYRIHKAAISYEYSVRTDKEIVYVRSITGGLLKRLGIKPTQNDLKLHYQISYLGFEADSRFLKDSKTWLEQILRANAAKKIYAKWALRELVYGRWLAVCGRYGFWRMLATPQFWMMHMRALAGAGPHYLSKALFPARREKYGKNIADISNGR